MTASTIDQRRAIYDRTADRSRETFSLVTAAVTVVGGTYLFDATATTFGEIRLDMQRSDNSWMPIASVTASDRPIELRLPANAVIRMVISATTVNAVVNLSRVPA